MNQKKNEIINDFRITQYNTLLALMDLANKYIEDAKSMCEDPNKPKNDLMAYEIIDRYVLGALSTHSNRLNISLWDAVEVSLLVQQLYKPIIKGLDHKQLKLNYQSRTYKFHDGIVDNTINSNIAISAINQYKYLENIENIENNSFKWYKSFFNIPENLQDLILNIFYFKQTIYHKEIPQVKQLLAICSYGWEDTLFGGSCGGGKSSCVLMSALQWVDVPEYAAAIFRLTHADLKKSGSLFDRLKTYINGKPYVDIKEKDNKVLFLNPNNPKEIISTISFGYLASKDISDAEGWQGSELSQIYFDECTQISQKNYDYMKTRNRKKDSINVPLRFMATSNPPMNDTGLYIRDKFVDPRTLDLKEGLFIPSSLDDNKYLDNKIYEEALKNQDEVTRRKLLDGDWFVFSSGDMFMREWFDFYYETLPLNRVKCTCWDTAQTSEAVAKEQGKNPDYTVGTTISRVGFGENTQYVIEDIVRGRWSSSQVQTIQIQEGIKHGKNTVIMEEISGGGTNPVSLKQGAFAKAGLIRYQELRTNNKSKKIRAEHTSRLAEDGKIKFHKDCNNISQALEELSGFGINEKDDIVDSIVGAIEYLSTTTFSDVVPHSIMKPGGSTWNEDSINGTNPALGFGDYQDEVSSVLGNLGTSYFRDM